MKQRASDAQPLSPEAFAAAAGVSRETLARLRLYADLLVRWQRAINLVGKGTLGDLWRRHMLDSAQLAPLIAPEVRSLLDLGSGAGFPGLVLAIVTGRHAHLVESDGRKCAFLGETARATAAPATVHHARIEALEPFPVDLVTARACAPLKTLLGYAARFPGPPPCLFLKGATAQQELTDSAKHWTMALERHDSMTDASGGILHIRSYARRTPGSAENAGESGSG